MGTMTAPAPPCSVSGSGREESGLGWVGWPWRAPGQKAAHLSGTAPFPQMRKFPLARLTSELEGEDFLNGAILN